MRKGGTLKVGILGGTFNPPHLGHLRLAEEVIYAHGLERVIFIPSFTPPHKDTREIAPPADRLEMTHRACKGNPFFEVSDVEIRFQGPSYTVNTLEFFTTQSEYETFFIIGTDSLKDIHIWKDYERLFHLSHFIVVTRPGVGFDAAWSEMPSPLRAQFLRLGDRLVHSTSRVLIPSTVSGLDISSSHIRALLREGRSIRYLVTESVRTYIKEKHLYGC